MCNCLFLSFLFSI
uniref:Uncharacterized protein n=1 Tax=Arundo donax TaxID=35708 RepID=A0A0A9S8T2_ARUDO